MLPITEDAILLFRYPKLTLLSYQIVSKLWTDTNCVDTRPSAPHLQCLVLLFSISCASRSQQCTRFFLCRAPNFWLIRLCRFTCSKSWGFGRIVIDYFCSHRGQLMLWCMLRIEASYRACIWRQCVGPCTCPPGELWVSSSWIWTLYFFTGGSTGSLHFCGYLDTPNKVADHHQYIGTSFNIVALAIACLSPSVSSRSAYWKRPQKETSLFLDWDLADFNSWITC